MSKKPSLSEIYTTQKSLTEWLEDIKHADVSELRAEDNEKRERLRVLNELIGIPFDRPVKFSARDISENTPVHAKYVAEHGDELCALRLIPLDKALPKLRMRGQSVREVQAWFREQDIELEQYRGEYMPHSNNATWSTIFVVHEKGITGEIIRGRHSQLTQGIYDGEQRPITFYYDWERWFIEPRDDEARSEIEKIVSYLRVDETLHTKLHDQLGSAFTHGYLKGYFETSDSPEFGLWFIDYAPKMGEMIGVLENPQSHEKQALVSGQVGCAGRAMGEVRLVGKDGRDEEFPNGAVLVCLLTTPEFIPLMQKAVAIVTDNGGILSHAAIVARELKIPCLVGCKTATEVLESGQKVIVDANQGVVLDANT